MAKNKRTVIDMAINMPEDAVNFMVTDFLTKNGFVQEQVNQEWVWQAGTGFLTLPKFFKYLYQNGLIHMEAWVKTVILPGVYGKEMDLEGVYGVLPKQAYKKDIDSLLELLNQPLPADYILGQQQTPMQQNSSVQLQGFDTSKKSVVSLVGGIISISCCMIPILGIFLGMIAIVYARKGMNSSKRGIAFAGLVLGILGIVLAIIVWILNIVLLLI